MIWEATFDDSSASGLLAPSLDEGGGTQDSLPPLVRSAEATGVSSIIVDHTSFISFQGQFLLGPERVRAIEISKHTATMLGAYNIARLKAFARYQDGWGNGAGRRLQDTSVRSLEDFVRTYDDFCGSEPSLFLTFDGMLELGWEDDEDNAIEVVMGDQRYGYFFESTGEEGWLPAKELPALVTRLRNQCR